MRFPKTVPQRSLFPWILAAGVGAELAYLAMAAIKLLDVGELEQRLAALEAAISGQKNLPESVFDADPMDSEFLVEVDA